jgi:hypothetical protein
MASQERQRLAQAFEDATKAFSQMVAALRTARGNSAAFDKALKDTRVAGDECGKARRALLGHITEHQD